jgi:GT2 family glycosyltransferase
MATKDSVDLSVVIVTYKSKEYILRCIRSIFDAAQGLLLEIIVADNNSGDSIANLVRDEFPSIIVIENKKNEGFARAVNRGVRIARGNYLCILNPDTQFEKETLKVLLNFLERYSVDCVVGARTIDPKGRVIPSCRSLPHIANLVTRPISFLLRNRRLKKPMSYLLDIWEQNKTIDVTQYNGYITGACIVTRLDFFKQIGMLDERYFLYAEDADFGLRIIRSGRSAFLVAEASLTHGGGCSATKNPLSRFYFVDAYIRYIDKNFTVLHGLAYKICFFILVLGWTIEACLRLKRGETLALIKALKHFDFFRSGGTPV